MKLDTDLVYRILKKAEKKPDEKEEHILIEGYDPEDVNYHVRLCCEAGLIHGTPGPRSVFESLTWQGHMVLNKLRAGVKLYDIFS